jgi:hypothetical protein
MIFSFFIILFLSFTPAAGFYERQKDGSSIDLRGMIRAFGIVNKYPSNRIFFKDDYNSGLAGLGRIIMQAEAGQTLAFEINAYQTYIHQDFTAVQSSLGTTLDVERSSALEWSFSSHNYIHAAIDRLNARFSKGRMDIILGRQPINLATTFFFSPNDFFAPFSAQAFYRVYKPGVDAIRAEIGLGDLSQLSLISVLGYERDDLKDTGWSDDPESGDTSYIGRVSSVIGEFEMALIAGAIHNRDVIGGSLQGDLFEWLGLRAEGHIAYPDSPSRGSYANICIGLEHHWESSLDMRLEYFYHGSGAGAAADYNYSYTAVDEDIAYPARNYAALGIGYEFTPLLNSQMSFIANLEDNSGICSFNAVYSLSNEAELALNLGVPLGKRPELTQIRSEFGLYPYSLYLEVRYYF